MSDFSFEARSSAGVLSSGTLSAGSEREAMAVLDSRGLYPVRISQIGGARKRWGLGGGVRGRHMATFYSQLADLLRAGVPLLRSLDILERMGANKNLQNALREVRARVADGSGLAEAMTQYPKVFDELAVSMVRAGQEGGFLEDVLKRIADFTEHQEDLKSEVVGAMAYPVFLAVVGFCVLNGLIIFFIPRFEPIFAKLRANNELPALTTWLISLSHFMWPWGLLVFLGLLIALVIFRLRGMSPAMRYSYDRFKLRIPGAGRLFLNLGLSRFTRILGTMLHNGIPILRSLQIAKDSTGNRVLSVAIEQSAENITAGEKLAKPLGECPYFPKDIVEMIAIGEESNSLETVLVEIADSLEKRTARQLKLFVKLLEPIMLLVMAAVVLVVVMGLMLPIFKMGGAAR